MSNLGPGAKPVETHWYRVCVCDVCSHDTCVNPLDNLWSLHLSCHSAKCHMSFSFAFPLQWLFFHLLLTVILPFPFDVSFYIQMYFTCCTSFLIISIITGSSTQQFEIPILETLLCKSNYRWNVPWRDRDSRHFTKELFAEDEYKHSQFECRLKQTRNMHCSCMFTNLKSKGWLHQWGLNP